ncbi:MAG: Gfo/Idh/MocA family oxidoreductase [Planctomycetota bacterium]|nr:Gfo/Idh/MocA family oxidoreductase [Planctomycetota bacterium]
MAASGGVGFGIVGLGMIAEFHAKAIQAMDGGHLACAFSRGGGPKADKFATDFGVKVYTGDYDAFLAHPGLDAVAIATPSGAHCEPSVAAAKAKKHVICEKPLEVTLERCDAIIQACKKNKVKLGGIFPSRTGGAVNAIKAAMDKKRFGRMTVCNAIIPWHRTQEYYDSGAWRGTWKLDGGGALMNQSIHTIDLLQWLAGPIKEISSYAGCMIHKRIEVEDAAVAAVKYKSGAIGVIVGSTAMWPGNAVELHICGDKGSAWLRGGMLVQWQFADEKPEDAKIRDEFGPKPEPAGKGGASDPRAISFVGHQRQFENFVRCIKGGEKVMVDGAEARKAVEVILGVYDSALAGKAVKLPLKKTPNRRKFPKT